MISQIYSTRENNRSDPSIISLGKHSSVAMLFGSLAGLDVVILNHKFSANEVAVYAVAQVLPDLMKSLFSVCTQFLNPRINAGQSLPDFWRGFRSKFIILTLVFSLIGIVGFFVLPKAITLLFSDIYIRSAEASQWLWLSMAVIGSSSYLGYALISTKRKFCTYATYVGYPVILTLLYFLFSNYGVEGIVGARILAGCILCGFYCLGFWLMLKFPPRNELNEHCET
jgi:Na+-driven multidrug efflux pump